MSALPDASARAFPPAPPQGSCGSTDRSVHYSPSGTFCFTDLSQPPQRPAAGLCARSVFSVFSKLFAVTRSVRHCRGVDTCRSLFILHFESPRFSHFVHILVYGKFSRTFHAPLRQSLRPLNYERLLSVSLKQSIRHEHLFSVHAISAISSPNTFRNSFRRACPCRRLKSFKTLDSCLISKPTDIEISYRTLALIISPHLESSIKTHFFSAPR